MRSDSDFVRRLHVGEHQILEADLFHGPGRVVDRVFGAHEERALPLGVAGLDDLEAGRQGAGIAAWSGQPAMRRQEGVDLPRQPHSRGDEHHQVVAGPLEVRQEMGGEHDAQSLVGDDLHQGLEELAPGERVQTGHRLVEDQQLRALGDRQGEGELGPLASRQPPGPLSEIETERADPAPGHLVGPNPGLSHAPSRR